MHITVTWDQSDKSEAGLQLAWAGQGDESLWLTTVQKIISLIEIRVGRLTGKLTVQNTLPLGKGMGSSTAVVVALARCFMGDDCKNDALAIEDEINKGHSGIDFAAIWEERPIVIVNGKYEFIELPKSLERGFLFDTGTPIEPTSIILQRLKNARLRMSFLGNRSIRSVTVQKDCYPEKILSVYFPITIGVR